MKTVENRKEKYQKIVKMALFACYVIFNGILLFRHELWRDEANVWLLVREVSPAGLMQQICYQGHPCLWYFLVMPFAKLGFPFQTISFISFLIVMSAAYLFTMKAPFHPITKVVCLFSPIFSYYYSVIARNYCLIAIILILLAFFYQKRNDRPILYGILLGLLVQTDTIVLDVAGLISLFWFLEGCLKVHRERRISAIVGYVKGLLFPLLSFFLWLLEFKGVSESPEYHFHISSGREFICAVKDYSLYMIERMTGQDQNFAILLIGLFLISGVLISVRIQDAVPFVITIMGFLFEAVFSVIVYQLHIWHYIAIAYIVIWFYWIVRGEKEKHFEPDHVGSTQKWLNRAERILPEVVLILLSTTMFLRWNSPEENSSLQNALNGVYSDGVNLANYMKENIPESAIILSTNVSESATVQAYLGKAYTFYYAGNLEREVYADYTLRQDVSITYEELLQGVKDQFGAVEQIYILESPSNCITELSEESREGWEICYQTALETARGEEYILYRVEL